MASFHSLRGSTFPSFQIGKGGGNISQGTITTDLDINSTTGVNTVIGVDTLISTSVTTGQGSTLLSNASTLAGLTHELRFQEQNSIGVNYVGFKSADSVIANTIWTLPAADGTINQMLSTNGAGVLGWQSRPVPYEVWASTALVINATIKVVPLDTIRLVNTNFTLALNTITFNVAGVYQITYSGIAGSTNTVRATTQWALYLNGVLYPSSSSYGYHRTTTNGLGTGTKSVVVNALVGDTIDLRVRKVGGNGISTTIGECNIVIAGV
jgi:hypothetical protein